MQRTTVTAVLLLGAVGFWYGSDDVFNTFKATVIALGALIAVTLGAVRAVVTGRLTLIRTPAWWAVGAFVVAMMVATVTTDDPLRAVVGRPGRHTGLAMYGVYVALFAVALRTFRDHSPVPLVKSLIVVAVPIAVYGLWQAFGFDPLRWAAVIGGPSSTFGNSNFFSAWLGVVSPLCVWAALSPQLSGEWRGWSAVVAVLALAAALASRAAQGPVAALGGVVVVLGISLWADDGPERIRRRRTLIGVAGAVIIGAVAVGLGAGPLAAVRAELASSVDKRLPLWGAGLQTFRMHPLTGAGPDRLGDWWHQARPDDFAAATGTRVYSDSAHSVPLDMLANGGVLLGGAYLAVVIVTLVALVRGLRRLDGADRHLLGGMGGAWVAYQLQSLVSIDVPPLAALHWVLAGIIVGRGWSTLRQASLYSSGPLKERQSGGPLRVVALAAVGVLTLAALVLVVQPFRADLVAGRAQLSDAPMRAQTMFGQASSIAFWEPRYPLLEGDHLDRQGQDRAAVSRYEEAVRRNPREHSAHVGIARLAAGLDDVERAVAAYRDAVRIDPKSPGLLAEAGRYLLTHGHADEAVVLLQRAVAAPIAEPEWLMVLEEARGAAQQP